MTRHNFATLVENRFTILSYKRLLKASKQGKGENNEYDSSSYLVSSSL